MSHILWTLVCRVRMGFTAFPQSREPKRRKLHNNWEKGRATNEWTGGNQARQGAPARPHINDVSSPAKEGSLARTEMVGPVPLHTYGDGWMIDALRKQASGRHQWRVFNAAQHAPHQRSQPPQPPFQISGWRDNDDLPKLTPALLHLLGTGGGSPKPHSHSHVRTY